MTSGKLQVKDIPDKEMIDLVDRLWNVPRVYEVNGKLEFFYANGASIFDICKVWDAIPQKLILAKLKKLIEQKKIDGCACGCRGEFTVIREGEILVEMYWDEFTESFKSRRVLTPSNRKGGH